MCWGLGFIRPIKLCFRRGEKLTFTTLLDVIPARRHLRSASSARTVMYVWGKRKLRDNGKMYSVGSSDCEGEAIFHSACLQFRLSSFLSQEQSRVGASLRLWPRRGEGGRPRCPSFLAPQLGLCSGWRRPPDTEHDVLGVLPVC